MSNKIKALHGNNNCIFWIDASNYHPIPSVSHIQPFCTIFSIEAIAPWLSENIKENMVDIDTLGIGHIWFFFYFGDFAGQYDHADIGDFAVPCGPVWN